MLTEGCQGVDLPPVYTAYTTASWCNHAVGSDITTHLQKLHSQKQPGYLF